MPETSNSSKHLKKTPLGLIPREWDVCPIEEKLAEIIDYRGKTPRKTTSGVPLITAKNVRDGYLDPEPREYLHEDDYDLWMTRGIPVTGDILFTTEAPLANVARFPSYKAALAQRLLTLRTKPDELDSGCLFWTLAWSDSRRRLEQRSTGSTVLGIKQSVFRKVLFRFPTLSEQKKIASILDTIDSLIALTDTHIAKLKQAKAGLLHDLLTRGIDEHGELRDPIRHPEQFQFIKQIGLIPKDWTVKPFSSYTISSAFGPRFSANAYDENGSVATLRTTDLDEDGNLNLSTMPLANLNLRQFQEHFLEVGDLIITRSGTCGVTTVFSGFSLPVIPGAFSIRFRLNQDLSPGFARQYFNWDVGRSRVLLNAEGGVQKNLKGSTLLKLLLPFPEISEQERILHHLNVLATQISQKQVRLEKLKFLKKGLMSDLLTGRVRVKVDS
jgi:type I restriction enzyme, S subunit